MTTSWSVIVGAHGSDKSNAAVRVKDELERAGLRVGGFVQELVRDGHGEALGWDIVAMDGERKALARRSSAPEICDLAFDPAAFALARGWAESTDSDVVVVGGIGKLEASGRGHWPLLESLIHRQSGPHVVASVRDSVLSTVVLRLPDPSSYLELPCAEAVLARFAGGLVAEVTAHRT